MKIELVGKVFASTPQNHLKGIISGQAQL